MSATSPTRRCPLCDGPLYGWLTPPAAATGSTTGRPSELAEPQTRVLERCEDCGVALGRGVEVDLADELRAVMEADGEGAARLAAANRASLQAMMGAEGWAPIDMHDGELIHTPASLRLLAERNGRELDEVRHSSLGRNQGWMWQTLLNALTIHPNFAREVRAGRLRPANARGRISFFADLVATALAAPLVALVALPLELVAVALRRGGEITAALRDQRGSASPAGARSPGARRGA